MRKTTRFLAVAVVALAAGGVSAWFGWSQLAAGTSDGPDRGPEYGSVATALPPDQVAAVAAEATEPRLRFGSVSVAVPAEDSGLTVHGDYLWPERPEKPEGGAVIIVASRLHDSSSREYVEIDATTGEVLLDTIGTDRRSAADAVVASVRVESEPAGVWPVADVAPTGPRVESDTISYIEPDASSGIVVHAGQWDGIGRSGTVLFVHNGRSQMTIADDTGEMGNVDKILPEDREAFERFAASVVVEVTR